MVCRIKKLNNLEQYEIKWNELNGLFKHGVKMTKIYKNNKSTTVKV